MDKDKEKKIPKLPDSAEELAKAIFRRADRERDERLIAASK